MVCNGDLTSVVGFIGRHRCALLLQLLLLQAQPLRAAATCVGALDGLPVYSMIGCIPRNTKWNLATLGVAPRGFRGPRSLGANLCGWLGRAA